MARMELEWSFRFQEPWDPESLAAVPALCTVWVEPRKAALRSRAVKCLGLQGAGPAGDGATQEEAQLTGGVCGVIWGAQLPLMELS